MSRRTYYSEQPPQVPLLPGYGVRCACGCGKEFQAHPGPGRPRRYLDNKHRARDFRSRAWARLSRGMREQREAANTASVVHTLGPWGARGESCPLLCTGKPATVAQVEAFHSGNPVTCPACNALRGIPC